MLIFMLASDEKYVFMKVTGYAQNRPMQMRTFFQANFVFLLVHQYLFIVNQHYPPIYPHYPQGNHFCVQKLSPFSWQIELKS